jgi:PAS domain S-box-containing protein
MTKRKSISKLYYHITLTFIIVTALGLSLYGLYVVLEENREHATLFEKKYAESQKQSMREMVSQTIHLIRESRAEYETRMRGALKDRVHEAFSIAERIRADNRAEIGEKAGDEKAKTLLKEMLGVIMFNGDRGYYFIIEIDREGMSRAGRPGFERKPVLDILGGEGNFAGPAVIDIAKKKGEGFVAYRCAKPGGKNSGFGKTLSRKISYVRYYEPFDWIIGTGEYVDEIEKECKGVVIKRIESIRYPGNWYIWINDTEPKMIVHPHFSRTGRPAWYAARGLAGYSDSKGKKLFADMVSVCREKGGGFVEYMWPKPGGGAEQRKMSYVELYPDWGWIVGAGFYLDDLNEIIQQNRKTLKLRFVKNAGHIAFLFGLIVVCSIFFTTRISRRVRRNFDRFFRFFTDPAGARSGIDENVIDISEFASLASHANEMIKARKNAESALVQEKDLNRSMIESSPAFFVVLDPEKRAMRVNRSFLQAVGYDRGEIEGKHCDELSIVLLPEEERRKLLAVLDEPKKGETPFLRAKAGEPYRTTVLTKSGERIQVEWYGNVVFRKNGEIDYILGSGVDVTERKKAEEQAKLSELQLIQADKMKSLGILVSGIGHEINNPNQATMLSASLLKGTWEAVRPILDEYHAENGEFLVNGIDYGDAREKVPEFLKIIAESAARIDFIVNELKSFVRQEAENGTAPVDVNLVVRKAVVLMENYIQKCTRNFFVELASNLPEVKGNYQRLEQVIVNLLENSCQALDDPRKGIVVSTDFDPETDEVFIRVVDEGTGIDPEDLSHVKDPFFTTRRTEGGSGLGLSVSSRIVGEHGGTLVLRSEPGKRTEAVVALPALRELVTEERRHGAKCIPR